MATYCELCEGTIGTILQPIRYVSDGKKVLSYCETCAERNILADKVDPAVLCHTCGEPFVDVDDMAAHWEKTHDSEEE